MFTIDRSLPSLNVSNAKSEKFCKSIHRGPPLSTTMVVPLQNLEEVQNARRQGIATDIAMIK